MCVDNDECANDHFGWHTTKGFTSKSNYGGVIGIARDGHLLYGPYNEDGELWSCSEHDICNGRFFDDGSYGYVSTTNFPYVVGCWGPSVAQKYEASCTTNSCISADSSISLIFNAAIITALSFVYF